MRKPLVDCLAALGAIWLSAQSPIADADIIDLTPTIALAAPAPTVTKLRQALPSATAKQSAKKPAKRTKVTSKSARRKPVQLAALGRPDLSSYSSRVLTEEEALKALEQELSLKVGKQIHPSDYPTEARTSRWSGTSVVQVQVGIDGMIRNVELRRSSGFEVLDDQALTIVRRVSKLFVPFRLRGREHAVTVPVGFYLKEA